MVVALIAGFFYLKSSQEPEIFLKEPMIEKEEVSVEGGEQEAIYIDISPLEAQDLITKNPELIIIDVSPNYNDGHLPNAINYYAGDGSLDEAIPDLDPIATYLVYCHTDSASIAGATKLVKAGFTNIYRLEGNYSAWVEAGFEVEK